MPYVVTRLRIVSGGTAERTYAKKATAMTTAIGKNWPAKKRIIQIKNTITAIVV
jgi:hypothetical protein